MHVEKNVCESIIDTLLDINGKSKDGHNARKDLQAMNIRHDLHPQERGSRVYLPPALHTLSRSEKQLFCKRLYELKLPDGYSSNISNCVSMEECKERIEQNTSNEEMSHSSNMVDDAISKVLGPDRGHIRGLGFGVTKSKLFQSMQKYQTFASLEKKCNNLTLDVNVLKNVVSFLLKDKEKMSEHTSNNPANIPTSAHVQPPVLNSPLSVTTNAPHKCMLLDWIDSREVIAGGRWSSSDPLTLVHHIPLGPNAVRV